MCALQRERRFNLGVIDNENLKLIKLAAGEDRGKLFDTGRAKILLIIMQSLVSLVIKKATEVAFLDQILISTYLEM
jgi:hypothetical protein